MQQTIKTLTLIMLLTVVVGCVPIQPVSQVATESAGAAAGEHQTYILVHGAFQDHTAWSEVVPLLEAAGHTVLTPDLPGRRGDPTAIGEITLDSYRDSVIDLINQQSGKVVLVGHSFGGITISAVAEAIPDKIAALVYVAAYLPVSGDSLASLAAEDHESKFNENNFLLAPDYSTASVLQEDVVLIFCADCSAAFQQRTLESIQPEPLGPMNTPVTLTTEHFGTVRKIYVETLQDNAVSHALQTWMIERTPVEETVTLDTGHAPFFVDPQGLATALLELP